VRIILSFLFIVIIINGCKNSSNPITSGTDTPLSVSQVRDSMQYTFAIPKDVFGIHDTLSASITAFNQSTVPETLVIYMGNFQWSLKNDSGRTLMWGPEVIPQIVYQLVLYSHQSKEIYGMRQVIMDTSGAPVVAGSYLLQGKLYGTMLFTLYLSLQ
jgi:hypothetical protein